MEKAVTQLELLFQKAKAELDYIQSKLELELREKLLEDPAEEMSPAAILRQLPVMKARYKSLCERMDAISKEQKEIMESICASLGKTIQLVQTLQQKTQLESSPLSAEEQAAVQQLNLQIGKEMEFSVEEPCCAGSTVPSSPEEPKFTPVTAKAFMNLSKRIRSSVKLEDVNYLYKGLFNHFVVQKNKAALSVAQMNKMNMKATDARIKILNKLGIVRVSRQGNVKLVM